LGAVNQNVKITEIFIKSNLKKFEFQERIYSPYKTILILIDNVKYPFRQKRATVESQHSHTFKEVWFVNFSLCICKKIESIRRVSNKIDVKSQQIDQYKNNWRRKAREGNLDEKALPLSKLKEFIICEAVFLFVHIKVIMQ